MYRIATAGLLAAATLLAGCSAAPPAGPSAPAATPATSAASPSAGATSAEAAALLAAHNLTGRTPEQIIETLDRDARPRPLPLSASVRTDEVILSDGATEVVLPLTSDRFYLSLAPYRTRTHDCFFHNLGTCQGELAGEQVHVTITDSEGVVLVDTDATTYANGFVAFWIPKGTQGTVTVTADGLTGEAPFSSNADGATCLTTLKIS